MKINKQIRKNVRSGQRNVVGPQNQSTEEEKISPLSLQVTCLFELVWSSLAIFVDLHKLRHASWTLNHSNFTRYFVSTQPEILVIPGLNTGECVRSLDNKKMDSFLRFPLSGVD